MSEGSLFLTVLVLSSPFLVSVTRIIFQSFFFIELSLAKYYVGSLTPWCSFRHQVVQRSNRADLSRRSSCREEWYCHCGVGQIPIQIRERRCRRQVSSTVMANKHRRRYRRGDAPRSGIDYGVVCIQICRRTGN